MIQNNVHVFGKMYKQAFQFLHPITILNPLIVQQF